MSRLKFSPNLFLEVNELKRFNKFLEDDGWKRAMKSLVKSYGIVETKNNPYFKVTLKAGSNDTVIVNPGLAFDSNLDAIVLEEPMEVEIPNTGSNRWIVLSRGVKNTEKGTVTVTSDGSVSGTGTEFLSVLRGQPNFPVKVRFPESRVNTSEYEVVSVSSDYNALLSGALYAETGVKYAVVGTFTPGFRPKDEDRMIYEYDACTITVVDSKSRPAVSADEFVLGMVSFSTGGTMSVTDERIGSMFNNPYYNAETPGDGGATNFSEGSNPIVSLLEVGIIDGFALQQQGCEVELIVEHGYTVRKYELVTSATVNVFTILDGSCNFLGTGAIPNGMFRGWLLYNRVNMLYATITDNESKKLYLSMMDNRLFEGEQDLIIVPDVKEIEYEVRESGDIDYPKYPFHFHNSIQNPFTRLRFYVHYPIEGGGDMGQKTVTINLRYRLIDYTGKIYPLGKFCVAQYEDYMTRKTTLADSSFNLNLTEIQSFQPDTTRNYS